MLEKVERLISEINRIHLEYSKDYFETGKVEKVNLKYTFAKVPTQPILLNIMESKINFIQRVCNERGNEWQKNLTSTY